jgi:hypothetical protein
MNERVFFLFWLLLGAACSTPSATPPAMPSPTPTLAPGKGMVIGRVVSQGTGRPISQQRIWLAEVYREGGPGAYILDTSLSPFGFSDQTGQFVIANVNPKEYVIVIGDPFSDYSVIVDDTGNTKAWSIPADQMINTGDLAVDFGFLSPTPKPVKPY